ncbi:MAG TPA: undecaprenyl-diphosphate phosphatase [Vicinamibacteria bacterium]|nr:undecaprenyl-diphosphate phosphatase [Vicinamibacteria bacterium]
MTLAQAILLGIVQGLTEFLPISSSGHLIVMPWLLGWGVQSLAFDVALHIGTLTAVLWAFAGDWLRILRGAAAGLRERRPLGTPEGRLLLALALACVPAVIAGLALEDWAETTFRSPALVAVTMTVMGTVLFLVDRRAAGGEGTVETVTYRDALLIGAAQALALVPGVSRSGSTISMALFLRYRREEAARFSFLLSTPITFAAAVREVPALFRSGDASLTLVLAGIVTAALVGFAAIRGLLAYVRTRNYLPFVYYRLAFAALIVTVLVLRSRA